MATNSNGMTFPIFFDLDKAVKDASNDWDGKYAAQLEKAIQKRTLEIKLKVTPLNFDSLDSVKQRLAQLKIEPITPETKTAIKELAAELRTLAKALEQVQKYSARAGGTPEAVRNSKIAVNEQRAAAARELAHQRAAKAAQAEERLAAARLKSANAAEQTARRVNNLTNAYNSQSAIIDRLARKMVALWAINNVREFFTNIREVTAQFELQRVSLGAIIQDQARANQLFSEIKTFALKSPISIMDLTKYTKQVAAYKIETDKLFDTTKRLADMSVGLGVDMGRLVLAYGQVKAASYLRAAEIRQFTEAGIPMLELLAEKFEKLNGKAVTTEQVMEMVSKRMVGFEMVEDIFNDMTSAGGMFYNMQEKQGNTLFGLWAKLGDAASVMYDEIGNTGWVNEGIKATIELLTDLMRNWREVGRLMGASGLGFAAIWATKKVKGWQKNIDNVKIAANQKYIAASNAYRAAIQAEQAARSTATAEEYKAIAAKTMAAEAAYNTAKAEYIAVRNTTLWSKALGKLKATLSGNWITLTIAAIAAVATHFYSAYEKASQLKNALKDIKEAATIEADQSVMNFEALANAAVKAADGSKQQREALQELENTYKNIIPLDDLKIEKLRAMQGNYESLTVAIREYVAQQKLQEGINTIVKNYADDIKDQTDDFKKALKGYTFTEDGKDVKLSDRQVERIVNNYKRLVKEGKNANDALRESFKMEELDEAAANADQLAYEFDLMYRSIDQYHGTVYTGATGLTKTIQDQERAVKDLSDGMDELFPKMGKFGDYIKEAEKAVDEHTFTAKIGTFEYDQESIKTKTESYIKALGNAIQDATKNSGTKINLSDFIETTPEGVKIIDYDGLKKAIDAGNLELGKSLKTTVDVVEKKLEGLIPSNRIALSLRQRFFEIADSVKMGREKMRGYLWDGQGDLKDHRKNLAETLAKLQNDIHAYEVQIAKYGLIEKWRLKLMGIDVDEMKKEAEGLIQGLAAIDEYLLPQQTPNGPSGGSRSDNRLQILNEMVQLAEKLNKEYSDWEKKAGRTKALDKVNATYKETVKYAEQVAKEAGIKLPHLETPTNAKELNEYLEAVRKVMDTAKGLKGGKKAAIELAVKMSDNVSAEDQKAIETKIKQLADRISRTKTAREFYNKILSQTGDVKLAARLSVNVYGEDGDNLNKQIREQIEKLVEPTSAKFDYSIFRADGTFDAKKLRRFAEEQKDALGGIESKAYQELIKLSDNADKDFAKTIEGWLKAIEKAKTYGDKLTDVYRRTSTEIERIQAAMANGQMGQADSSEMIAGFERKQAEEIAKLQYEAFKDSPIYIQMFDDLDHASTKMLTNMKARLQSMQGQWKNLDPTQLKELQSRLNEIDDQLTKRNPFKTLIDSIKEYRQLRTKGDARGNKSRDAADADMLKWTEAYTKAEEELAKVNADKSATEAQIAGAKQMVNYTKREKEEAERVAENWKKVEDAIGLSANELLNMLNWGSDIASAIASISEAMGADEEDVQYWNDIASALGDVASGIHDIVKSAVDSNVIGVVSSVLTAIPKMFVGFTNLFSAGKIKKANKEIKWQQELLDQLEYTYGRLEKAAEKALGSDYISNFNQQQRILEAQARAYKAQADAERSKGKKEDKEKTKEYEDAYRDTMDEIADMQGKLAEKMMGTDVASAARDFAKAWLDAKLSFGDTTAAIQEKFQDMIKNMIVESATARLVQSAMQPFFDEIDKMYSNGASADDVVAYALGKIGPLTDDISNALETWYQGMKARGIDLSKAIGSTEGEYTGIKRDVAGASEETMNNVAVIGNTLMYYVSPIPVISENITAMRALMEVGTTSTLPSTTAGWTDWQQQAMDHYAAIQRNTAETVVECRKIAERCTAMATDIHRVVVPRGTKSSHGIQVYM